MIQFSLDELKEIEEVVSGGLKLKIQQIIKREENGVITIRGDFIPFSKAKFIEVRGCEDENIDDVEVPPGLMPSFYEEGYERIYPDLEGIIEKYKKKIKGDVFVISYYDTGTALGFNTVLIKALRINGVDTPVNY